MGPLLTAALPSIITGISSLGAAGINAYSNSGRQNNQRGMQQQGGNGFRTYDLGGNRNPQLAQAPTQTQQGQQVLQQLLQRGQMGLQNAPNGQFGPIREAYEQDYRQNGLPSIAERFAALGEGAGSSSGFRNTMQSAEGNLHQQLAGMEQGFNQQNIQQLLSMLGLGLSPQFETFYQPRQQNWWESLLGPLAQGVGSAAGAYGASKLGNWAAGSNPSTTTAPNT